ncbi:MAG: UDP-N-acetylmuramoyl-tripeptide--D-alanyl-D-alanine ligase [Fidelibacterota bacterium]|nr:MAG: UDP-N-acetylmuramoyl-tripeptide--D-alanyl-D-alanine ligase [Candidatus Neomarinimicrobiota bacterium]
MRIDLAEPARLTALLREHYSLDDLPEIKGITIDSRQVRVGDMFVPIVGNRADGHTFIPNAVESGAVAVMAEHPIPPLPAKTAVIQVSDTIEELGTLARIWRGSHTPNVVAITGSNGKTTTKNLVIDILATKFKVLGTESSYNSTIGLPLTLLRLDQECEIAVLELGSNLPGEIAYLARIAQPEIGLITNVSETHVAHLDNKQGVIREKEALFMALPSGGTAVVNMDDAAVAGMKTSARRLTYGFQSSVDVTGWYEETQDGGDLLIGDDLEIRIPYAGKHLAGIALAAAAVGLLLGVSKQLIKETVESLSLPPGRGEILHLDGITVIDDSYNANLASTLVGLETLLRIPSEGRRFLVFGDMLELGRFSEEHHRQVGEFAAANGIDEILCYGPETRATYCSAQTAGLQALHFENKSELSHALSESARPGDVVYVKGSRGMAMETIIQEAFNG